MEQYELKTELFNIFAFLKYILESKATVAFPKDLNTEPYKKPDGFGLYDDENDRTQFKLLEPRIQEEIRSRVKTFHYYRQRYEEITKSFLIISGLKGGQHTLSVKLVDILFLRLKNKGIKIIFEKKESIFVLSDSLINNIANKDVKQKGFLLKIIDKIGNFFSKKTISDLYKITFSYAGSTISLTAFIYYVDNRRSFISFVENSVINVNNGDIVVNRMRESFISIMTLLPLMDIIDEISDIAKRKLDSQFEKSEI